MAIPDAKDETSLATNDKIETPDRWTRRFSSTTQPEPTFRANVTLAIGPDADLFTAHAHMLKSDSGYFRRAIDGKWEEAVKGHFKLLEENPAVFAMYLDWLYNHQIVYKATSDSDVLLVELYLLGERRESSNFCNAILNKMHELWTADREIPLEEISLAFSETNEKSKLRSLIADKCAWEIHPTILLAQSGDVDSPHPELALAVYQSILRRMLLSREDASVGRCSSSYGYHVFGNLSNVQCLTCNMCVNLQHFAINMSGPSEAPYKKDFCANYHVHAEGEQCK